jgi:hypothetical protein
MNDSLFFPRSDSQIFADKVCNSPPPGSQPSRCDCGQSIVFPTDVLVMAQGTLFVKVQRHDRTIDQVAPVGVEHRLFVLGRRGPAKKTSANHIAEFRFASKAAH